jgi:hypothetical protein
MSIDESDPERPEPEQPDAMPEEEGGVAAAEPDTLPKEPDVAAPDPEARRKLDRQPAVYASPAAASSCSIHQ